MLHHLTPPDVSGSTLLPNADVSQTSFFKTPLLLVRATYILRLLNIPDTDIGGFVAQRLLADNARWVSQSICSVNVVALTGKLLRRLRSSLWNGGCTRGTVAVEMKSS